MHAGCVLRYLLFYSFHISDKTKEPMRWPGVNWSGNKTKKGGFNINNPPMDKCASNHNILLLITHRIALKCHLFSEKLYAR